ncbi:hypothetical protein K439DRAFT_1643128 [Ramaria rubella]|nr:hypothetical protein K439DRAFT_1643128 [Ramaria rubella]
MPAIEFTLNSARSESTGYSPCFVNHGHMPQPMVWDSSSEYCSEPSRSSKIRVTSIP